MAQTTKINLRKVPLWKWVVAIVVILALIHFIFVKFDGNKAERPQVAPTITGASVSDNIYLTKTDPDKGGYLTDFAGLTLYTFDKDSDGVSNCYDKCAEVWPYYTSGATAETSLPANISVVKRTDGHLQFAWMGKPLYYYSKDEKAGDLTGDGVNGSWHIVKP